MDVARGELVGATNRYMKTLADLEGLYEDAVGVRALQRTMGDAVVYEVTDYKPSANPGDMIIGVTRMRPGQGRPRIFPHPRPHPRQRQPAGDVLRRERDAA